MQALRRLFSSDCSHKPIDPPEKSNITADLSAMLSTLDAAESRYRQAVVSQVPREQKAVHNASVRELRSEVVNLLKRSFVDTLALIAKAKLDPAHVPGEVAAALAEVISRYGIACYANHDCQPPFQAAQCLLQTALLFHQYALGLADHCPDLSLLKSIDDLYQLPHMQAAHQAQTAHMLHSMEPSVWNRIAQLESTRQLINLSQTLRYLYGCMRNVVPQASAPEKLIETAMVCIAGETHPAGEAILKNELAEVTYDYCTLLQDKAQACLQRGEQAQANELLAKLHRQLDECVAYSDSPQLMLARCMSIKLQLDSSSLEQQLEQKKRVLDMHLALPKAMQQPVLTAMAWHNLSYYYKKINNTTEAAHCAKEALTLMAECLARGENHRDFVQIKENAQDLLKK